jgi:RNA polymerase sigma factor (sigma-70 family)
MNATRFNELLRKLNYDESAYVELYRYFQPRAVFYLTNKYKNLGLAEDIVQDFFFRKQPIIKASEFIKKPARWIFYACEKLLQTELSREKPTIEFNESEIEIEVAAAIDEDILAARHNSDDYFEILLDAGIDIKFVDVFRKIDRNLVEIFIMRYFEGFSDKEIAAKLGIRYDNLRKIAYRGKKILKNLLKLRQS